MKDSILNLVLRRMAQGYGEQIPLYEKMFEIVLEQEKNLQSEEVNMDSIVDLINKRQEIIHSLEVLNSEMGILKEDVRQTLGIDEFTVGKIRAAISVPGVEELDEAIIRLGHILSKIKDLDKHNEDTLRSRIKETRDKLTQLQNAKKANEAYQYNPAAKDGVFIDFSK